MSNPTPSVRYEYREFDPQFPSLGEGYVRIETSDLAGIIVERISRCEKPESPEPTPRPQSLGQLSFCF